MLVSWSFHISLQNCTCESYVTNNNHPASTSTPYSWTQKELTLQHLLPGRCLQPTIRTMWQSLDKAWPKLPTGSDPQQLTRKRALGVSTLSAPSCLATLFLQCYTPVINSPPFLPSPLVDMVQWRRSVPAEHFPSSGAAMCPLCRLAQSHWRPGQVNKPKRVNVIRKEL